MIQANVHTVKFILFVDYFYLQTFRCQVEELQEVAAELEREKENLLRKVSQRDKQLESYKEQLSVNQKQLAELQNRLAKVTYAL